MPTYLIADDVLSQLKEDLSNALQEQQTGFLTAETIQEFGRRLYQKYWEDGMTLDHAENIIQDLTIDQALFLANFA